MFRPVIRTPLRFSALAAGIALAVSGPAGSTAEDPVRIEGLRSISTEQARKWIAPQLATVATSGPSMARADDLAFFLETEMRRQGYSQASVDWEMEGSGAAAGIVLRVSEGDALLIGTVSVEGNESLGDDAAIELLTAATRKRLGREAGETIPYVKGDLEQGRRQVEDFYGLLGFRHAAATLRTEIEGSRVHLVLGIVEGTPGRVGSITIPPAPDPALEAVIAEIRNEFEGRSFTAAIPGNLVSRLRSAAVEAGYYHAGFQVAETEAGPADGIDRIDLAVTADWGETVPVAALRVEGNRKVENAFFDRHFGKLVGQPYSPTKTNEAVDALLQSGAFETVRTDLVEDGDGSHRLDIEVEEGPSRTLGVYGGFTNYEGPVGGFEFRHLNLFGTLRKLDAAVEFSKRGGRGEVNYTDPWFLDSDFQFGTGLFALNRDEEGYEKFKTGGRYEFSRHFGPSKRDSLSLFGEAAYTDVHDAVIDPALLGDREYFAHQIGLSATRDRRDDPRHPRRGHIAQASLAAASSAFGSEIEYLKATGRLGYYLPVKDHTLRLGARGGWISPMGDTADIPIDLRFFNGGPFSVRSFQERSLGPRDPLSGEAVGGNFYTVFNAEYEIPVAAVDGLSVVPFADAGNLLFDDADASLDDLRYALGLSLRYETPIGPIRAEYGFNPDQRPGEPEGTFHFGFGLGY